MNSANLSSFLRLGYFLDYPQAPIRIDISGVRKAEYCQATEEELIREGQRRLTAAVAARFRSGREHCVPLSGGWDSRVILGELLKHTDAARIHTFTFGIPGAWDFELGNAVAAAVGTDHTRFDLTKHTYTRQELLDVSRRSEHQTMLFLHPPLAEVDRRFGHCHLWSGFLGDPLAGSHLPKQPGKTLGQAKRHFLAKNTMTRLPELCDCDPEALGELVAFDAPGHPDVTLEEQLDFRNRQAKFIAPHVLLDGLQFETPFLDPLLINFWLGVPDPLRRGQVLYQKIALRACGELFRVGTTGSYGLPPDRGRWTYWPRRIAARLRRALSQRYTWLVDPMTNYIEFSKAIRERADVRELVGANVRALARRGIVDGIDSEQLWNDHLGKRADNGYALLALCSLEIHLQAGKELN